MAKRLTGLRHIWQIARDLWEGPTPESAIHGLPVTQCAPRVKSDKSDWLRIRNDYSAHAPKIESSQRSRLFVLTKTSAASGDENAGDSIQKKVTL